MKVFIVYCHPSGDSFTRCIRDAFIRGYIDLLGDRFRLESRRNREIDNLPEAEKAAIRSTFAAGERPSELWAALVNLTDLVYKELEEISMPVTKEMLQDYYADLR